MPKGEAKFVEYNPGEAPTRSTPVEDGKYELKLKSRGKPGPKGWRKKTPKSFPNRMLVFSILGTEDEITGREKEVVEFASLSPGFSLQKIAQLAYAAGYPKKVKLAIGPKKKPNDPTVMQNMKAVDELLEWIEDEEPVMRAFVAGDEYNGEERNKVGKWLPPDAEVDSVSDDEEESEDEGAEELDDSEGEAEDSEEEADEDEADEDEEAEEVDDESDESEESEGEEEAEEDESDEDSDADEADEEFEPIPPPRKKKGVELDSAGVKKAKAKHAAEKAKAAAKAKGKKKSKK